MMVFIIFQFGIVFIIFITNWREAIGKTEVTYLCYIDLIVLTSQENFPVVDLTHSPF